MNCLVDNPQPLTDVALRYGYYDHVWMTEAEAPQIMNIPSSHNEGQVEKKEYSIQIGS